MKSHHSAHRIARFFFIAGLVASSPALGLFTIASSVADAKPKKPELTFCSLEQLDKLAKKTSQRVVDVCGIQGRSWVCAQPDIAQCCGVNRDGSLGHCSGPIAYHTVGSGFGAASAIAPGPGAAPSASIEVARPGVVSK